MPTTTTLATIRPVPPAGNDVFAARVLGTMTREEFEAYMVRCNKERRQPITFCPTAIADVGGWKQAPNTFATRWHGLTVRTGEPDDVLKPKDLSKVPVSSKAIVIGPPSNTVEPPTVRNITDPWLLSTITTYIGGGRHKRDVLYKLPMTIAEAIAVGIQRVDIRWDIKQGRIIIG